jgi:hypothetical protein
LVASLQADDSLPVDSADLARDDCSAAPLAADSARDDYLAALSADDSPPVDSADSAADDLAVPDSSFQDAHSVLAGCPDDSPAGLRAVDSQACQVWRSADFRAAHFQVDPVCQHSAGLQAGCPDEPGSAPPVFLAAPS